MIEWEGGKKKQVSRLNLLFDEEDKANFQKRVESAFQYRFYCEALLKRATRLEKKDLEKVPHLPIDIFSLFYFHYLYFIINFNINIIFDET